MLSKIAGKLKIGVLKTFLYEVFLTVLAKLRYSRKGTIGAHGLDWV